MNKLRISLLTLLSVFACLSVALLNACKEDEKLFAGVSQSEVTIELGETYQFNIELTSYGGASTEGITAVWTVEDESIVTIDQNGLATGVEVGSTVVMATLSNGQYISAMVTVEKTSSIVFQTVTVNEGVNNFTDIEDIYYAPDGLPSSVHLSVDASALSSSDSLRISVEDSTLLRISDIDDPTIHLTDTVIAIETDSIYFNLKPLTLPDGVTSMDTRLYVTNGNLKTYLTVHIGAVVTLSWDANYELATNSMSIYLQDGEVKLTAYAAVTPTDYWTLTDLYEYEVTQNNTSNPAAYIEDFDQSVQGEISWTIKPQTTGTTKMTVTSRGESINLILKVVDKENVSVNSVTVSYNNEVVAYASADSTYIGTVNGSTATQTLYFEAETSPLSSAATWPVEWSSSNESVAYYNEEREAFTVLADGETQISATSKDVTAVFNLIIKTELTGLAIASGSRSTLMVGETEQYSYTTTPSGVSPTVIWESDDTSVAYFGTDGLLYAVGEGTTNIRVKNEDGSVVSSDMTITVVEPFDDYDFTGAYYYYEFTGGTFTLQAQKTGELLMEFNATLGSPSSGSNLENGTYTFGDNMTSASCTYDGKTGYITSGTMIVSGGTTKEFEFNLEIGLESHTIYLTGDLEEAYNIQY